MAVLTVNGAAAPSPSGMKVVIFEVGPAQMRTASGALAADCLGLKRRLELQWNVLTPAQLGSLLQQVAGNFFEVEYPDPGTADHRTMTCRCGECTAGVLLVRGGEPVWTDIRMEWIER